MRLSSQTKWVIANWKMNGSLEKNDRILHFFKERLSRLSQVKIVVCVPYPYLYQAQQILQDSSIAWGAQNASAIAKQGAFTGEVSASMLRDFGASYVILGHSERSLAYCENRENIARKFLCVKEAKMTPILCVGETLVEREAGMMERVIEEQLSCLLKKHGNQVFENSIISYEPIWAIGTEFSATPEQIKPMVAFIRKNVVNSTSVLAESVKIAYGGGVNPNNIAELLSIENMDGVLVGHCSLDAEAFEQIAIIANSLKP